MHTHTHTHTHTWSSGHTHTPGAVDTHTHLEQWTHTHTWSSGHTHTPGAVDTHTHLEQWTHTHTWSSGHTHTPGVVDSWGFSALLKGLTSVVDNSCRSLDSNPQPRVTSPTLFPLGHDCPGRCGYWSMGPSDWKRQNQFDRAQSG